MIRSGHLPSTYVRYTLLFLTLVRCLPTHPAVRHLTRDKFDFGPEVRLGLSHERPEEAHAHGEHAARLQTYKRAEKVEVAVNGLDGKAEEDYHCKGQVGEDLQTWLAGQ